MLLNKGFSLIEVMVSLFILSCMLLGLDAMQIMAMHQAKAAYYFSTATQQLSVMSEYLSLLGDKDFSAQLAQWNKQNQAALPQGRGVVSGHYPTFLLSIFWGEIPSTSCNENKIGQSGCLSKYIKM